MSQQNPKNQPVILIVEDREDDILLIQKAFQRAKIATARQIVRDGGEAIAYLSGAGKYSQRDQYPLPWLVLLDLKMPRVDGFEVLKWIRSQPGFKSLIVVVLTSSEEMRDVNDAYHFGANSFLIKPQDFENAINLADLINAYWLQHNRSPDATRQSQREINGGNDGE